MVLVLALWLLSDYVSRNILYVCICIFVSNILFEPNFKFFFLSFFEQTV